MRIAFNFCVFCVLYSASAGAMGVAHKLFGAEFVSTEAQRDSTINYDMSRLPNAAISRIPLTRPALRSERYFFIKSLASAVNYANREILKQRVILEKKKNGVILSPQENATLSLIYDFYKSEDIDDLLIRVAPVSTSLAVAQASLESRFGGCKHMSEKNAYFGLSNKRGRKVLKFDTVMDSVIGYVKSLNVNGAYKKFREQRAKMIASNQSLNGVKLIGTLKKYSVNPAYGRLVAKIIKDYKLEQLDRPVPPSLLQAAHKVVAKHGRFSAR